MATPAPRRLARRADARPVRQITALEPAGFGGRSISCARPRGGPRDDLHQTQPTSADRRDSKLPPPDSCIRCNFGAPRARDAAPDATIRRCGTAARRLRASDASDAADPASGVGGPARPFLWCRHPNTVVHAMHVTRADPAPSTAPADVLWPTCTFRPVRPISIDCLFIRCTHDGLGTRWPALRAPGAPAAVRVRHRAP